MTTVIQPGSIRHKILEAILELGAAATGAAIRKRHPSNEHLVNISIEQLTKDGLIEITSEGNYRVVDKKAVRAQSVEGAAAAVAQQRKAPVETRPEPPKPPAPAPAPRPTVAQRVTATEPEKPAASSTAPAQPPRRAAPWQSKLPDESPQSKAPPASTAEAPPVVPSVTAPAAPPEPPPLHHRLRHRRRRRRAPHHQHRSRCASNKSRRPTWPRSNATSVLPRRRRLISTPLTTSWCSPAKSAC